MSRPGIEGRADVIIAEGYTPGSNPGGQVFLRTPRRTPPDSIVTSGYILRRTPTSLLPALLSAPASVRMSPTDGALAPPRQPHRRRLRRPAAKRPQYRITSEEVRGNVRRRAVYTHGAPLGTERGAHCTMCTAAQHAWATVIRTAPAHGVGFLFLAIAILGRLRRTPLLHTTPLGSVCGVLLHHPRVCRIDING